jgi:hypothetical protein
MDQNSMNIAAAVITIGGAGAVIMGVIRPVYKKTKKLFRELESFTRDWFGEPAGNGRDAVPSVMERLNRMDGELQHNHGTSMKDAISRIEQKINEIDVRLEDGNQRFEKIEERLR